MTTDKHKPLVELDFTEEESPKNQTIEHSFLIGHIESQQNHIGDNSSIISLSSSSTTDEVSVPEVCFDNINLDSNDSRESQPLLGGREPADISPNNFPGKYNTKKKLAGESRKSLIVCY